MEVNYVFTEGKKITSKLLYTSDDHLFRLKNKYRSSDHYNCYVEHCSARVIIKNNKCFYEQSKTKHVHGSQKSTFDKFKLENTLKKRVKATNKPPRILFNEICLENSEISHNLQYQRLKRTCNRIRSTGIPPNPKTMADVVKYFQSEKVLQTFGLTLHKLPTMFYWKTVNLKAFGYSIFVSESILNALPDGKRSFRIDGTFKGVPKGPFMQLLIISVDYLNHVRITSEEILVIFFKSQIFCLFHRLFLASTFS